MKSAVLYLLSQASTKTQVTPDIILYKHSGIAKTFDSRLLHPAGSAAVLIPDNLHPPNPGIWQAGAHTD